MLKLNRDVLKRRYFVGHVKPTGRFSDEDWLKVLKAFHQDQYLDTGDVELKTLPMMLDVLSRRAIM